MRRILLAFIFNISLFFTLTSQSLAFVKYQVEDGLSHNSVLCVMQDSYDFMWFGTSDGLNCFDGKNFRIFRSNSNDINSIGNNSIQSLYEDQFNNIWVGTNKGLYIFDRKSEKFSFFTQKTEDGVLVSSSVSKILKSKTGLYWFATLGQGVFVYDPITKVLVQNSMYSSFVQDMLESPKGNIYVTSRQNGLICFDEKAKFIRSYIPTNNKIGLSNIEISALCYLNNTIWFNVGTFGFYKLDLTTDAFESIEDRISTNSVSNIRKIYSFSSTELWVGGDNGLYDFDIENKKFTRLDDASNPKSLSDQSVNDIASDREGGMWVSTYFGGVNYLPKNLKPFEHYFPKFQSGSISGKVISQFCEDADDNIWIATEDGGLNFLNTKTDKAETTKSIGEKNSLSYHNVHSLMLDENKLWIGTFSRGVDIYDIKSKSFKNYQHRRNDPTSICDNAIYSIYKTTEGVIYIGTAWGLCTYNPKSDTFSLVEEIGAMAHIFNLLEDSIGNLWVATYNTGLFRLQSETKKWDHFTYDPNDPKTVSSNSVISIFEDNKHILWFGTEGSGLCSFDEKTQEFTSFDPENKILPNPVIYSIQQDEFNNFWIACNAGLVRINPYTKANSLVFTKADGLQSNQFNFRSSLRAKDGKMYFGGINGFNAFYPKDFVENSYIPKIRIVEFRLFNKKVNISDANSPLTTPIYELKKLNLKYNQNAFSFSFAALSYQAPDKNQYVYMLEGADKNWNVVENGNNSASYSNLTPGTYILRVKGSNNDGLWNKNETTLTIYIAPPFWKSGFAYFLYFILIITGAFWIYSNWLKKINHANEERIKSIREKQEKESYLSKINFFTNISHEIRTPLSLIKLPLERIIQSGDGNEKTKSFLNTINKNTDYLLNLINQLLDIRKTEESEFELHVKSVSVNDIILDTYTRFKHTAEIKNIKLEINIPSANLIQDIDREAFNKIISNLLSNAMKYAKSEILIDLSVYLQHFEISISDNGKGIPDKEIKRIYDIFYQSENSEIGTGIGLALAKALVEKHSGTLNYKHNETGGSTFIISIPITIFGDEDVSEPEISSVLLDTDYKKHFKTLHAKDKGPENKMKVLLVEDNEELLEITSDYLQGYYKIYTAINGRKALGVLAEHNVDLVVSDVMMPIMDGYQLCEAIKTEPQSCHIPVILLTAKTNVESKIMGLEYGSDAYLEKPFSLEHLQTQIENLLTSRHRLKELFATSPLLSSVEIAISKKDVEYIDRLNNEIETHLLDVNFSIDALSDFMNMSRSNFYRKIKSISGMSPNDYLKTIRLKKAAKLLLSQEYRINEVYEQAGFSSSSYFAKCFKEQFGMLPREFVAKASKVNLSNDDES